MFVAAYIFLSTLAVAPVKTDVLFIPAHAGETNELIPIMEEMQIQKKDFRVLPLGVAQDLITGKIEASKILKPKDFGFDMEKNWPIDRELSHEAVKKVAQAIHAKVLITGVAMIPQGQFLEEYKQRQSKTFAYWDNPEPHGALPYFTTALKVQAMAGKVLFPSGFVAHAKEFESRPDSEKIIVGRPTLKPVLESLRKIDRIETLNKLGFSVDRPVVAFIGTYGDRYERAFRLFLEALRALPGEKPQIVFQIHPMAKGDFEEKSCQSSLADKFKFVVSPNNARNKVSMLEAMAVADLVVTYNSSAGFQALLGGKRVLYVVPEGDGYSNSLIERGVAVQAGDVDSIQSILQEKNRPLQGEYLLETMEIPLDAKERFSQLLNS